MRSVLLKISTILISHFLFFVYFFAKLVNVVLKIHKFHLTFTDTFLNLHVFKVHFSFATD